MGLSCKIAAMIYDFEQSHPVILKLERRMCTVERELNKDNPCFDNKHGKRNSHHKACGCGKN